MPTTRTTATMSSPRLASVCFQSVRTTPNVTTHHSSAPCSRTVVLLSSELTAYLHSCPLPRFGYATRRCQATSCCSSWQLTSVACSRHRWQPGLHIILKRAALPPYTRKSPCLLFGGRNHSFHHPPIPVPADTLERLGQCGEQQPAQGG